MSRSHMMAVSFLKQDRLDLVSVSMGNHIYHFELHDGRNTMFISVMYLSPRPYESCLEGQNNPVYVASGSHTKKNV